LDRLFDLKISDIDQLPKIVKDAVHRLEEAGGQKMDEIKISTLFHDEATFYAYKKSRLGPLWDFLNFPKTTDKRVWKSDLCICEYINEKWLISSIRHGVVIEDRLSRDA
jgi:hypothetical protein